MILHTVAAELSKKKMDDPMLMTLHNIAFGKAAKRVHLKTNLRQFRGVQYDDQLDRAKLEQRVSSRSHLVLQKLCGILHLSAGGSSADLTGRIADFLECPMDTQPAKKGTKSAATKKEAPEDDKATPKASPKKASPKKASPKKASPKKASPKKAAPKKTETAQVKPAAKKAKTEKSPAKKTTKKEKSADETAKTTTKKNASKGCSKSCKK